MRNLNLRLCLVSGICLIFLAQFGIVACWAESVRSYVTTYSHYSGQTYHNVEEDESTAENALLEVESSGELSQGSFSAKANVITNYGRHQTHSTATINNGFNEQVIALANSYFEDDWIVRTQTGDTWGEMTIGVTLHGNFEGDGNNLYYGVDCEGSGCKKVTLKNAPSDIDEFSPPTQVAIVTIEYDIDTFFTIESTLEVNTYVGNYEEGVSKTGSIDFGHTAVITSLTLPAGHTLETASGTTYPLDYTPPGTDTGTTTATTSGGGGGGGCFISNINK